MFAAIRRQALITRQNVPRQAFDRAASIRALHQSSVHQYARKDSQDKDSIVTESTEYSKSGSDSAVASDDAAFSRDKTRPEEQQETSSGEPSGALNASPANTHMGTPASKQDDSGASPSESDSSQSSRQRSSGGDSPKKHGSSPAEGQ